MAGGGSEGQHPGPQLGPQIAMQNPLQKLPEQTITMGIENTGQEPVQEEST